MTSMNDRGHNAPCSNRDFDFFYRGLEEKKLLAQKCARCGTLLTLPSPACGNCGSLDSTSVELSGEGTVFSFVTHYHPPLPGFDVPHVIAVVELREGGRLLGAMDGTDPSDVAIGNPVQVEFLKRGDVAAYRFRNA